jgi:hypothetical protein
VERALVFRQLCGGRPEQRGRQGQCSYFPQHGYRTCIY